MRLIVCESKSYLIALSEACLVRTIDCFDKGAHKKHTCFIRIKFLLFYGLLPLASGFFGGVLDFNKMNIITRRTFGFIRPQLEKDGFKESPSGVYDLRDWEEIRGWAKELAVKARNSHYSFFLDEVGFCDVSSHDPLCLEVVGYFCDGVFHKSYPSVFLPVECWDD